ncbi:MAG: THUMP domain-containing protein [Acidobacteriota bacterium]
MPTFLLHLSGELSLKSKDVRQRFTDRLVHNLADALRSELGKGHATIRRSWSRVYVDSKTDEAGVIAARIFGVKAVAKAERRPWRTVDDLLDHGAELFAPAVAGRTFAVRVKRGEQASRLPFRSPEVERQLGARLIDGARGVDLRSPEVEAWIELHGEEAYFFARPMAADGGLPVGTGGRALCLISGGFDSAVAAWAMLRRGVRLDYVFCNLGGDAHVAEVLRVAKVLADRWSYGYRPRLHLVDFRPVIENLRASTEPSYWQLVLKRRMLCVAEGLARPSKAVALVTGEAIAQVASQTLHNLSAVDAACRRPILRPLLAWNKEDILALARHIGTYDASASVPEYCGLEARRPETHATPDALDEQEARTDDALLRRLLDERTVLDLRAYEPDRQVTPDLVVDAVPDGATLLDLRPAGAFRSWHPDGARHAPYPEILDTFRTLDQDADYVAVCEIGLKSAQLVERMVAAGYRAATVGRGIATLRKAQQRDPALDALLSPAVRDDRG